MERVTGIGGVFIRSARAPTSCGRGTHVTSDPIDYFGPHDRQAMVNYRVRDLDAMHAQLREAGVGVEDEIHELEYGRFGWATDLDGNRLELWEPAPGH